MPDLRLGPRLVTDTDGLVALALEVAHKLDQAAASRTAALAAGLLRRLAREIATGSEPEGRRCPPPCGAGLGPDPRARYCSPACRQRAYRRRRYASVTVVDAEPHEHRS